MIEIAKLAEANPEQIQQTPVTTPVKRMDETRAARSPVVADLG